MEIIDAISRLWRRKLLVLLGALIAVVAAYLLLSQSTTTRYGVAVSQLLVDFQRSTLSNATQDDTALIVRAGTLPSLVEDPSVIRRIIRIGHLGPNAAISVSGPFAVNEPRAQTEAPAIKRAYQVGTEGNQYSLEVSTGQNSPVISVYAQGPSMDAAVRLGRAVPAALNGFLKSLLPPPKLRDKSRVVIVRSLGPPVATSVGSPSVRLLAGAGVGVGVFAVWCMLVLVGDGLVRAVRFRRASEGREGWEGMPSSPSSADSARPSEVARARSVR